MSAPGRQRSVPWRFYGGLAVALAVVPVAYFLWLGAEPPPPPVLVPLKVERVEPRELKVSRATGTVELRRGADAWRPAQVGEVLSEADTVRTAEGAQAVLTGGELYEVSLEQDTELSVSALNASLSRFSLEGGVASARVRGGGPHQFEVKAHGGEVVARTSDGAFTIGSNRAGTVAVGTQSGEVELSGQGKVVIVRAGQQSIVQRGQSPSEPIALPKSLLLNVQLPERSTVRTARHVVRGRVEVGARVEVNGQLVEPDAQGAFAHPLELREGANAVRVQGWSVSGLKSSSAHQVELDSTVKRVVIDRSLWDEPAAPKATAPP